MSKQVRLTSVQISNLRCIEASQKIDIKPVTLLVGRNSSGKSSFLRLFPLLKQTTEVRTSGALLWYGNYVDYGSFKEVVNKSSKTRQIDLSFYYDVPREAFPHFSEDMRIKLGITVQGEEITTIRSVRLAIEPYNDTFELNFENPSCFPVINQVEMREIYERHGMETKGLISSGKGKFLNYYKYYYITINELEIISRILEMHCPGLRPDELKLSSATTFLPDLPHETRNDLRRLYIAAIMPELMALLNNELTLITDNINYIKPLRATAERYYRIQELAVDRIDPQGVNVPMFIKSLSAEERQQFETWCLENIGFKAYTRQLNDQIEVRLVEVDGQNEYNLADMGFGFSQILPIITQLWAMTQRRSQGFVPENAATRIFCIEQPELHLHPSLQAKIADMLASTIKAASAADVDVRLIIETHSETLINRIGSLIENGRLRHDDVNVVLFEKDKPDSNTKVSLSGYDNEGYLTDWPYGFFQPDEG